MSKDAEHEFDFEPLPYAQFKSEFEAGYFRFGVLEDEPPLEGWKQGARRAGRARADGFWLPSTE